LLAVDRDAEAIDRLASRAESKKPNVTLVAGNYADLPALLRERNLGTANGVLLDLGFSSDQIGGSGPPGGEAGRGFSFTGDEPLLMTYDRTALPAWKVLKGLSEDELVHILREYGEERFARPIAHAIRERERKEPIRTTGELSATVRAALPGGYEHGRIDPATRTFQALRIYVNGELDNLKRFLGSLGDIVRPGGRVVVISFHSLEDRLVKRAFADGAAAGGLELLTRKPIEASREESLRNPRSRSAKLRAAKIVERET
jgi:16S rRNA (cytosine1402-N4)-methyltransferase